LNSSTRLFHRIQWGQFRGCMLGPVLVIIHGENPARWEYEEGSGGR
jgi:hypothetical protein